MKHVARIGCPPLRTDHRTKMYTRREQKKKETKENVTRCSFSILSLGARGEHATRGGNHLSRIRYSVRHSSQSGPRDALSIVMVAVAVVVAMTVVVVVVAMTVAVVVVAMAVTINYCGGGYDGRSRPVAALCRSCSAGRVPATRRVDQ